MATIKERPSVPRTLSGFQMTWDGGAGQWVKKIAGKRYRYGADPVKAWRQYCEQIQTIGTGRNAPFEISVRDLCSRFLDKQYSKMTEGSIIPGTFGSYREICGRIVAHSGSKMVGSMMPLDFSKLRSELCYGTAEANRIRLVSARSIFKFGWNARLLKEPAFYGDEFDLPSAQEIRKARATKSKPLFDAETVHRIIDSSDGWMKAATLLGINAGFYSKDVSDLRPEHIDGEFIDNCREKTGSPRRCWLWPETREAIEEFGDLDGDNAHGRLFVSRDGGLLNVRRQRDRTDLVASRWRTIKRRLDISGPATGFKNLRHTFRTEASQGGDSEAVNLSMAHLENAVSNLYNHRVNDARLIAVSQRVRNWVFER